VRATRALPDDFGAYGPTGTHAERRQTLEAEWRARSGRKRASIAWALSDTFPNFWLAAPWKILSDAGFVSYPLLIKEIIKFTQEVASQPDNPPGVGKGVGLAFGLFGVILITYTAMHQYFWQSMHEGVLMRTALIGAVYKRAFELSADGRASQPDGKLMTFLSADISRIDTACEFFHCAWISPMTLVATIILLCIQIGPSALVGVLVFLIAIPIGTWNMKLGLNLREQSMEFTERRTNLLQGILSAMGVVKMFTYELPFIARLNEIRQKEVAKLRNLMYTRALTEAMTMSLPTLAAVFALVLYTSITPQFNPAIIFTALAYFNSLRQPLNMIPRAVAGAADAYAGMKRMQSFFEAETLRGRIAIDSKMDLAVEAVDASFTWISGDNASSKVEDKSPRVESPASEKPGATPDNAFAINNLNLSIPRGQLVAVIGPVGSGKSSLLQGLLGDMMRTSGTVRFGGRLGYCQQSAWIQNATIRDNILFGRAYDEDRYWGAVRNANLIADLDQLVNGDKTEIGEKGVNISGGQKQRINIARALYFDADIVLMDDPLSAVDPHVGKALFNDAILGLKRAGKTVILVTHGLHFLSQVDYIYSLDAGRFVQQGTYAELMAAEGGFKTLMGDFGGATAGPQEDEPIEDKTQANSKELIVDSETTSLVTPTKEASPPVTMIQEEERITGAVGLKVYLLYFKSGGAFWLVPAVILVTIMTTSSTMSSVWLTYWSENKFTRPGAFYQGIYGTLGVITALFTLFTGMVMTALSVQASRTLYNRALKGIFFAPMSFFDTNPLGRLMGVCGKGRLRLGYRS
jgi:ABC-type multidrug transport system fused ATPase/permease subunit